MGVSFRFNDEEVSFRFIDEEVSFRFKLGFPFSPRFREIFSNVAGLLGLYSGSTITKRFLNTAEWDRIAA